MGLRRAFTLIELLVVVAVIALLISILLPTLSAVREQARGGRCLSQLRAMSQGLVIYTNEYRDVLVPGRLPRLDHCNWYAEILGGRKYRPTYVAMMSVAVGMPPFDDPRACGNEIDRFGEAGDRQNYASPLYVCPTAAEWTDERNGAYGYNYQFLGNSRLRRADDPHSWKNWPVKLTQIHDPGATVALADCMGTAASFRPAERREYENNGRDAMQFGNEGFNLDPPRIDPLRGESANFPNQRSAADPRHRGKAGVLFVDGHGALLTLRQLGYEIQPDGVVSFEGRNADNSLWTGDRSDAPWTEESPP